MQSSQVRVSLTLSFDQFPELEYLLGLNGRGQRQFEVLRLIEMGLRYQAHLEGHGFKRHEEDSKKGKSSSALEQTENSPSPKPAETVTPAKPEKTATPPLPTETIKAKEVKAAPVKKAATAPVAKPIETKEAQDKKGEPDHDVPDDVFYDPTADFYEVKNVESKNDGSQAENTKQDSLLGNFLS